jgi:hypothetical protein
MPIGLQACFEDGRQQRIRVVENRLFDTNKTPASISLHFA